MKKKLLLIVTILCLFGCSQVEKRELDKQAQLSFFYIKSCSDCKAFKKNVLPYIEKVYGDSIVINQYDLDDPDTEKVYDSIIDSLQDFDEEYYGTAPFIVLNGYFALLGYTSGDEDYLIDDIENALNHKELSLELSRRFYFR